MKKIIEKLNKFIPFKNKVIGILYFLCISPLLNYILINIYYYNCGGNVNNFYDVLNLVNPLNIQHPLCIFVSTLISSNIYIVQYINYLFIIFIIKQLFY